MGEGGEGELGCGEVHDGDYFGFAAVAPGPGCQCPHLSAPMSGLLCTRASCDGSRRVAGISLLDDGGSAGEIRGQLPRGCCG